MNLESITVYDHYQKYLPVIDEPTFDNLKNQIREEGILNPVVLWKTDGKNILLDGHNRYRIAQELSINDVPVSFKNFDSDEDAEYWIICNQLNRRNLTERELKYFIGAKYNHEKKNHGALPENKNASKNGVANFASPKTAVKIAEQYGISERSVHDYAKDAEVIEALPETTRKNFLSGGDAITTKEIRTLAKVSKSDNGILKKLTKQPDTPKVRELLKKVTPKPNGGKITENKSNLDADPDVYLDLILSRLHSAIRKYIQENGLTYKQDLVAAVERKLEEIKNEKY